MEIESTQPKGFSDGVYMLSVTLSAPELRSCYNSDFSFEVPEYPQWLFRPSQNNSPYQVPRPSGTRNNAHPFLGLVHDGKWVFILQSNGVFESENPHSRSTVLEALRHAITTRLSEMGQR